MKYLLNDGLRSLVGHMGNADKDKTASTTYSYVRIPDDQLIAAYSSSWVAKKIVNLPANDMIRKWRTWESDNPLAIASEERRLKLKAKILECKIKARLFGGAAIFMGTGQDLTQPLNINAIKKGGLRYLKVLDRRELIAGNIINDPLDERDNRAEFYTVSGVRESLNIHPSHFAIMMGEPNMELAYNDGWGISILQSAMDAIKNADSTAKNIAGLVFEANVDIVGIPDLAANLASGGESYERAVLQRIALFAQGKGISGVGLLDKEEEYKRNTASFAQLPDLLENYLMIAGASEGIPASRFLGSAPKGLNSTGEGDMKNYYDGIQSKQNNELSNEIAELDLALQQSAGVRGEYAWEPLEQANDSEEAANGKTVADTLKIVDDLGVFSGDEMREISIRALQAWGIEREIDEITSGGMGDNDE